jgi:hypothetical protein
MAEYGGLGGVAGGRGIDPEDRFEIDLNCALGDKMRINDALCARVWGSLANCGWRHDDGSTASYSYRAAGDMIAAIIGRGDYCDWYCSSSAGKVDPEVEAAMLPFGWRGVAA